MPGPNDNPQPIRIPSLTPSAPDPAQRMVSAEQELQRIQTMVEADKTLASWVGKARQLEYEFERIHAILNGKFGPQMEQLGIRTANDLKRLAPEFNLSLKQILNMPMTDLAKNFGGVAVSAGKLMGPFANLATAVSGTIAVYDKLQQANRDWLVFMQGSMRTIAGGAFTGDMRELSGLARADMARMGIRGEGVDALMSAVVRGLPTALANAMGPQGAAQVGGMTQTFRSDPQTIVSLMRMAFVSGDSATALQRRVDRVARGESGIDFGSNDERLKALDLLGRNLRALGGRAGDAERSLGTYNEALKRGRMTVQEIAEMQNKALSPMGEMLKIITLARNFGVKLPRGVEGEQDPFKAASALMRAQASDPAILESIVKQVVPRMAVAGTGSNTEASRLMMASGVMSNLVTSSVMKQIVFPDRQLPGSDRERAAQFTKEAETAFQSYVEEAKRLRDATRTAGQAMGDFTEFLKQTIVVQPKNSPQVEAYIRSLPAAPF